MPNIQHKRGTRAALDALASSNALLPWQLYGITDESRLAIATSASTYSVVGSGGVAGLHYGATPPVDEEAFPFWLDTEEAVLYVWYDDGTTGQWIGLVGGSGGNGSLIVVSPTAPENPTQNMLWLNTSVT